MRTFLLVHMMALMGVATLAGTTGTDDARPVAGGDTQPTADLLHVRIAFAATSVIKHAELRDGLDISGVTARDLLSSAHGVPRSAINGPDVLDRPLLVQIKGTSAKRVSQSFLSGAIAQALQCRVTFRMDEPAEVVVMRPAASVPTAWLNGDPDQRKVSTKVLASQLSDRTGFRIEDGCGVHPQNIIAPPSLPDRRFNSPADVAEWLRSEWGFIAAVELKPTKSIDVVQDP